MVELEPALDLGLTASLRGTLASPMQGGPLAPTLEGAFDLKALEPARLQAFLTPAMREALLGWPTARRWEEASKNTLGLWVTDESVIVRIQTNALGYGFSPHPLPGGDLVRDIRNTAALASAVNEAATHVPPSSGLALHVAVWRAFASTHGLAFVASPLRMSGVFDGVTFAARAALVGAVEGYGVELTMPFARPLPFYLRLGPTGGWFDLPKYYPDAWAEWARPKKTGDDAFDDALRVVSVDPAAQNELLTPEIRGALLALLKTNEHVHLTTDSISVRTKTKVSPDAFAGILRPLSAIEKMIDQAAAR